MKNKTKNISALFLLLSTFYFLLPAKAYAVCQVICPIIVASTLTLMEKYGIDNTISGLWIGGALTLASLITIDWINKWKKHWSLSLLTFILFYTSTILPLYIKHIIGNPIKEIWGIDKTLLGIIIGSIFFYLGNFSYEKIKEENGGHAWFPFQKVLMPIFPLIIFSIVFYFITKS